MMEGAFHQQKSTNPTALAIVLLMHGAALTALALAKGEVIVDAITRTKVFDVKEKDPPPPEPVKPVERSVIPPRSVVTHVPPVIQPPDRDAFAVSEPLPPEPVRIDKPAPVPEPVRLDPPAPPQPRMVEPARAKANLASYVSDTDYPPNAVRNEEQGTTRFRLAVGPDGKVRECIVTSSSGSSALDATTCRLMKQRAKFTPARNNRGEPTGDTVANAIRWVLPTD
ncbi:MAG TPA: TonB family protein [Allosphingosinicella sp.]|nr:TonB family protein [Allosphingosinicella sp.]